MNSRPEVSINLPSPQDLVAVLPHANQASIGEQTSQAEVAGPVVAQPAVMHWGETEAYAQVPHAPNHLANTGSSPWLPIGGGILAITGLSLYLLRRRKF